jgi:hypothetical protein
VCQGLDEGVRHDSASASQWSFRSSYHQAQLAWRRAFELRPAISRNFETRGTRVNQWFLWTATNRVRSGQGIRPDTGSFLAFPSWRGDTLAFIPYRAAEFYAGRARVAALSTLEAIRRQRRIFYDLASEWRSADPRSTSAREASASALWLLGNPTAPDSMHAARAMAGDPRDRVRLGLTEALMLVLQGAPDQKALARARSLADSLLGDGHPTGGTDPWDVATLAALTGRANYAARMARLPGPSTSWALPPALASDALALLVFSSLGGPADSLQVLEQQVARGIATSIDPKDRTRTRLEWIARPATLAHFVYVFPSVHDMLGYGDYLIDAEAAHQAGDTTGVRRQLADAVLGRAWMQPSDLSFETLLPEALLLQAIGDSRAAIARLNPTLSALASSSPDLVRSPVGTGVLVRAMALRAELASQAGDANTAALWARAVATLWSDADPFLQPIVRRMQDLARVGRA